MTLSYSLEFLSDWHCGSGLSSGSDVDSLVIKDENHLPYIPGKTIKGLFKDALLEMDIDIIMAKEKDNVNNIFGFEIIHGQKVIRTIKGKAFFSNAELSNEEKSEISGTLSNFLYRKISTTAIEATGIAKKRSLRATEICMPLILNGYIEGIDNITERQIIINATKWLRNIGVGRNRGFGRCRIIVHP